MKISQWLDEASNKLADAMIPSARLDAEIILAHTINKPRTWLHAHSDDELDPRRKDIANARAELRLERVPIAYIIGHKEFYGRRFYVTPDVLIPRPESEAMINLLKKHRLAMNKNLVDVGAGSGCLGITAKLEFPELDVTLLDISKSALIIAQKNAKLYDTKVSTLHSDLLSKYPLLADIILANLPYVDPDWLEQSPEINNEPKIALYSNEHGLALIRKLLQQIPSKASHGALTILEADLCQHDAIIDIATKNQQTHLETDGFALAFRLN